MNFLDLMEKYSTKRTENGALGYNTSGSELVDLNFAAASLRSVTEEHILNIFKASFNAEPKLTLRWLFYARDIRGGLGERRVFRVALSWLMQYINEDQYGNLFLFIEKYGRYDDFISMIEAPGVNVESLIEILSFRLGKDIMNMHLNKPITLLGKWMPSINASSPRTRQLARKIAKQMGISHKEYRLALSSLRSYSKVVETQISANEWDKVDYSAVPTYANLKYKNAFRRHDADRYSEYLLSVNKGEAKINAATAFPYDIVSRYTKGYSYWNRHITSDETLELMWQKLPIHTAKNTLVVADGSGSMTIKLGKSNVSALDVANSLAIYTSEHNEGPFANKYITFSDRPQFVEFGKNDTLCEKLLTALEHDEVANTNIEAVFELILKTAIKEGVSQEDMPERILIISDMEFDDATYEYDEELDETLFEGIAGRFNRAGYKVPKLVFWNVNSRTRTIPIQENELGVALVSGFSSSILDLVMSDKLSPFEVLAEKLAEYSEVDKLFGT